MSSSRRKSTLRDVPNDEIVVIDDNSDEESEEEKAQKPRSVRRKSTTVANAAAGRKSILNFADDAKNLMKPIVVYDSTSSESLDQEERRTRKVTTPKRYIQESEPEDSSVKSKSKTPKKQHETVTKTPKKPIQAETAKTPHSLRTRMKRELDRQKVVISSESDDFSADDDGDFVPEGQKSESSESEGAEALSEGDESSDSDQPKTDPLSLSEPAVPIARGGRQKATEGDFVLKSDEYFMHHSTNKAFTSDRTLENLKTRLKHDELFALLESMEISPAHEKSIKEMVHEYKVYFRKWMLLLDEGFSILLYGFGSKQKLIQSFHEQMLAQRDVLVVNGFFPTLNIRDILENLATKILEITVPSGNPNIALDLIEECLNETPAHHVFLLIHNIDGPMLRNEKSQMLLSRLTKIPNIHLVASIDHINAPMLWNPSKLANFNFSWWDVTTMLPYRSETAFENSILVQNSGALALSSFKSVFLSLTTNARSIYLLIVNHQLANRSVSHYQGMPFKGLYLNCRDSFLVNSDLALRSQLTEFLDHKLVKMKRSADGKEHLVIPIENGLLQKFKDELE